MDSLVTQLSDDLKFLDQVLNATLGTALTSGAITRDRVTMADQRFARLVEGVQQLVRDNVELLKRVPSNVEGGTAETPAEALAEAKADLADRFAKLSAMTDGPLTPVPHPDNE